jgi:hypothetical protein
LSLLLVRLTLTPRTKLSPFRFSIHSLHATIMTALDVQLKTRCPDAPHACDTTSSEYLYSLQVTRETKSFSMFRICMVYNFGHLLLC